MLLRQVVGLHQLGEITFDTKFVVHAKELVVGMEKIFGETPNSMNVPFAMEVDSKK